MVAMSLRSLEMGDATVGENLLVRGNLTVDGVLYSQGQEGNDAMNELRAMLAKLSERLDLVQNELKVKSRMLDELYYEPGYGPGFEEAKKSFENLSVVEEGKKNLLEVVEREILPPLYNDVVLNIN